MIEIQPKTILSKKNTMNVYRGCTHGCIYCDSRSEIYKKTYNFEEIEVKKDIVGKLRNELKKRNKAMIMTGSMCDPYMPIEAELQHTRKCLEVIEEMGFGVSIITKSDLILRDLELLKRIQKKARVVVSITLTTFDEELCRALEPGVCTTKRRFEVLKTLHEEGIPTIVWLCPILPLINDTRSNIDGILSYCKEAQVKGILTFGLGMTLRYGNREYYYKKLDEHFPGIKLEYMRQFGARYGIGNTKTRELNKHIKNFCKEQGIMFSQKEIFEFMADFPVTMEQLSLF